MKILFLVFSASLFLSVSFAKARSLPFAQPKLVKVPGTKVSLVPPAGLKPSERFPGFGDEGTGSSIMITETQVPYSEMAMGLTKEALATNGMSQLSRREISLNGKPGILFHLRQEAQPGDVLKWMVLTGDEKETVLITAAFPERIKDRWSSEMENAVLSAHWDVDAEIDPLAGLNFSFEDDPSLKFARRMSNNVMLTKDGALPDKPASDPVFVIGSSLSQVTIPDIGKFAEKRLTQIEQVSGVAIRSQSDVSIAGLSGSEIIAEAKWNDLPDSPVVVYQVILLDGKNYFLMQGFAPREEQERYLAIFYRIAQSFRKK